MSRRRAWALDELHAPLAPFPRETLAAPAAQVAPRLLGAVLKRRLQDGTVILARIVETEAYSPDDPASHSCRGVTDRCRSMFGEPGTAYVYRSYGVHWCLNVAAEPLGVGAAVLLRAAVAIGPDDQVRARRPRVSRSHQLLRGPGCLTQGLAVSGSLDGRDLLGAGELSMARDMSSDELPRIVTGPRVGVSRAAEKPWRFWLEGVAAVSSYRRSPNAASGTVTVATG